MVSFLREANIRTAKQMLLSGYAMHTMDLGNAAVSANKVDAGKQIYRQIPVSKITKTLKPHRIHYRNTK
jgi:hypothetical protein